jgi:hypothetical protein
MAREDAYAKYKDASGEPQFAESCVLFFDLLGISAMAQDARALEHLIRLRPALEAASERAGTEDPTQTHASTWFTDNLVIGTPVFRFPQDQEGALLFTLVNVSYLFLILLEAGFLGRGGIAFGQHYMDDRFVFGPALIDAAELEKATKQPRVALAPETATLAAQIANTSGYYEAGAVPHLRSLVVDESDGAVFVDPVGVWLSEEDDEATAEHLLAIYKQRIEAGIEASAEEAAVQRKWLWLADYFNWSIRGYVEYFPGSLVDSAPREHRFTPFHETVGPIR